MAAASLAIYGAMMTLFMRAMLKRRALGAAVKGVPPCVAHDPIGCKGSLSNCMLGHASRGNTDLDDCAHHAFSNSLTPATLPSVS